MRTNFWGNLVDGDVTLYVDEITVTESDGYMRDMYGFVNGDDEVVISHKYDHIKAILGELAIVTIYDDEKQYKVINIKGETLNEYDDLRWYGQYNKGAACLDGKWGVISERCDVICPIEYEDIALCNESTFFVRLNKKWGVINSHNELICDFKFDDLGESPDCWMPGEERVNTFNGHILDINPLIGICIDGKWGYMNADFEVVCEPKYDYIKDFKDDTIYAVTELLRRGESVEKLHEATKITELFINAFKNIVEMEKTISQNHDLKTLISAKTMGFSDKYIAKLWNTTEIEVYNERKENGIYPKFKMVDTCHTNAYIPYFYSSYIGETQVEFSNKKKIVVLGAGPIRIGQGVEFDYSTVHAVSTIRKEGYEAIIINNNPETVSTDYTTADKLYFEPLTPEDVMNIIEVEKPIGVVVAFGGQTAIISRVVYTLVGLAAIWCISLLFRGRLVGDGE